jgi:hypothetical protein
MASFNQAVDNSNISEPQDSEMVVKIKHSARGLADAPQVDAPNDPPQVDTNDLIMKSNKQINERLDGIEKSIERSNQQINERLNNIEVQISIE